VSKGDTRPTFAVMTSLIRIVPPGAAARVRP
jgi:hypothetical protein